MNGMDVPLVNVLLPLGLNSSASSEPVIIPPRIPLNNSVGLSFHNAIRIFSNGLYCDVATVSCCPAAGSDSFDIFISGRLFSASLLASTASVCSIFFEDLINAITEMAQIISDLQDQVNKLILI